METPSNLTASERAPLRVSGDAEGALTDTLKATEIILSGVGNHATPEDIASRWPQAPGDAARAAGYARIAPHLSQVIRLAPAVQAGSRAESRPAPARPMG